MLISGGKPPTMAIPKGVQFEQLPPMYSADSSFTRLLDAAGNEIDDAWREDRKQRLLELFSGFSPHVLITETFPFGRRMLRFELLPLLQAANDSETCLLVIASIRDILQPKSKAGRNREICDLVEAHYDHVLVHGDESLARLVDSFADAARIEDKLYYSGYICSRDESPPGTGDGSGEVLVSAGGSDTGYRILQTAIDAKPESVLRDLPWRLLVSHAFPEESFAALKDRAGPGIRIERNRADFRVLLRRARLSISQAGYNTVTDILASETPAIVIPFAEAGEIEQSLRAQKLQRLGRVVTLAQDDLDANSLAAAIAMTDSAPANSMINLDGARNSALMVSRWLDTAEAGA